MESEMSKRLRAIGSFAVISVFSACGGGGDTTTPVVVGPVTTVTITAPSTTVAIGGTLALTAVATDAQSHTVTGQTVTWTSSNTAAATISTGGLVTGIAAGSTLITATASGISGTTTLTVAAAPTTATVQATVGQQFTPNKVDVLAGGTVTWQFSTLTHNVTFSGTATGTPQNIPDATSTSVSRSFTTAGTFSYSCTIHPGMTGTVVVH
jgi:plastocyanin